METVMPAAILWLASSPAWLLPTLLVPPQWGPQRRCTEYLLSGECGWPVVVSGSPLRHTCRAGHRRHSCVPQTAAILFSLCRGLGIKRGMESRPIFWHMLHLVAEEGAHTHAHTY